MTNSVTESVPLTVAIRTVTGQTARRMYHKRPFVIQSSGNVSSFWQPMASRCRVSSSSGMAVISFDLLSTSRCRGARNTRYQTARYALPGRDVHPLNRASFVWRTVSGPRVRTGRSRGLTMSREKGCYRAWGPFFRRGVLNRVHFENRGDVGPQSGKASVHGASGPSCQTTVSKLGAV